jgi:glycosyltransferase involved in cell wall biosynthesis
MPKLVLLFTSFNIGGIERSMVNLSHQFTSAGINVVLVVLRKEGPLLDMLPPDVQVVDLKERKNTFFALPKLVRALSAIQPDAVLAAHPNINFIAIWSRFFIRKQISLVISERSNLSMASQSSNRLSLRLRPFLERLFYPLADGIVAVSGALADDIAKKTGIPRNKISVIYNPVYSDRLPALMNETVPAHLFPPSIPIVLGVGRLVEVKDFKTLILAFAAVRSSRPAKLLILGEGPGRKELETTINELSLENDVCLPGAVINPFAYMSKASVVVLSSKYEGFPNVIAESLACGTPVVSTNCETGPAEILDNGRFGKLVPVGDIHAMARAIKETLDAVHEPEFLKQRASFFSASKSANQYIKLLFSDSRFDGSYKIYE